MGKGVIKEHGWFLDGASGHAIMETEFTEAFRVAQMFDPLEMTKVEDSALRDRKGSLQGVYES